MKRMIKYIGLFLILLIPFNVFGMDYVLGEYQKGNGGAVYYEIKVTNAGAVDETQPLECATTAGSDQDDIKI